MLDFNRDLRQSTISSSDLGNTELLESILNRITTLEREKTNIVNEILRLKERMKDLEKNQEKTKSEDSDSESDHKPRYDALSVIRKALKKRRQSHEVSLCEILLIYSDLLFFLVS